MKLPLKTRRLFRMSSFSLAAVGIVAAGMILAATGTKQDSAAQAIRIQGLLTCVLVMGLALVFRFFPALRELDVEANPDSGGPRFAGGCLVVLSLLNLAATLRANPRLSMIQAIRDANPELGAKIAATTQAAVSQGLALSIGMVILACYFFSLALIPDDLSEEDPAG